MNIKNSIKIKPIPKGFFIGAFRMGSMVNEQGYAFFSNDDLIFLLPLNDKKMEIEKKQQEFCGQLSRIPSASDVLSWIFELMPSR